MTIKTLVNYFMDQIVDSEDLCPSMFNLYLYDDTFEAGIAEESDFRRWVESRDSDLIWSDELSSIEDIDNWINKLNPYAKEFNERMNGENL